MAIDRELEDLRKALERYERLVAIDILTGIANRRALDQALEREWQRARRVKAPIGMLMLDVDLFKAFNDIYGHVAGDACLKQIAQAAAACLERPTDVLARYGGEEFAAVLPDADASAAAKIGERVRQAIERLKIRHEGSPQGHVTISVGCAALVPANSDAVGLIRLADEALYEAKQRGRNRVAQMQRPGRHRTEQRFTLRGNLPVPRSRFVGRVPELERIADSIRSHRLTTLIGPGGVGKTRAAIEGARGLAADFPDGIWFADLTASAGSNDVGALVASSLKGLLPPNYDAADLPALLVKARALLLLDNCEHVIEAAAAFADAMLCRSGNLRMLATSRERLAVQGEALYRVPTLGAADAVALLMDRAAIAGAAAPAVDEHAEAIVRELDGLPLAIELAAPRLADMTAKSLRDELRGQLHDLHASARGLPDRQQTLDAVVEWSYRLLSAPEQRLLGALAVFSGGWTLAAARAICAGDDGVTGRHVGELLKRLVAKSLVQSEIAEGETRFHLLETTRAYAQKLLDASAGALELARRHARYYAGFARAQARRTNGVPMTAHIRAIGREVGNVRRALEWFVAERDAKGASRMLEGLHDWLWDRAGAPLSDLAPALADLVARTGVREDALAGTWMALAAMWRRSDARRSEELFARARTAYERAGRELEAIQALRGVMSAQLVVDSRIDPALEPATRAAIARAQSLGYTYLAASVWSYLGSLCTQLMDDDRLPEARRCFEESVRLLELHGDEDRCGYPLGSAADVAFFSGDIAAAITLGTRAVALLDGIGDAVVAALKRCALTHAYVVAGDVAAARAAFREALPVVAESDYPQARAAAFEAASQLAAAAQRPADAATLAAYSEALFAGGYAARQRREERYFAELVERLREDLGEDFAACWKRGSNLLSGDAIALALCL